MDVSICLEPAFRTSKPLTASQFLVQSTTVATGLARVLFAHDEDVLPHPLCRLDQDRPKLGMPEAQHVAYGLGSQPSATSL